MPINIPTKENDKLRQVVERINQDAELHQFWRCANITAVDRLGLSDHGEVHVRIIANIALKLLRLLLEANIQPNVVHNYGLTNDDAEVIVVTASCLHDLGISIHRDHHEGYSLWLAYPKLKELYAEIYDVSTCTIMICETLHAIIAHSREEQCLTLEAGVVKVADALDMTKGRSRIPFEAGVVNIHSVSAAAIDHIELKKGETRPIRIEVQMNNSAGIFQLDELLKNKLERSSIAPYVEVVARIEGEVEKHLIEVYSLGAGANPTPPHS
ncbi:MAG: phosphohydrolase [Chloroflexi bacterium]|nr:phosphohydrolase [Chloroflexota bacterium]